MGYWLKLPKFCNCSETLHMQGYKVGHSSGLPTRVAMKYGGSNMADNHMQGYLLGYTVYLGSHVAMKNGRSNMAHLTAGLYISNVWRSTISHNNNTTYFEPSIFVYVHVHFVIPLATFTLRSNLSSKSLFSTYFGFRQLSFRYKNGHISGTTHQIFNKNWRIFYSCIH